MAVVHDRGLTLKAKRFCGLADPPRLAILEALRSGDKTVSEIVAVTGLSQPNTSAHLASLRERGPVQSRQNGRFVFYSLADPRIEDVLQGARGILQETAEQVYACTRYEEGHGQ